MENVECLNIENKSVKNFTYDVVKRELHLNTNEYVSNLKSQLDNTYIVDEKGNKEKIKRKDDLN